MSKEPLEKKKKSNVNQYTKYSGLAFQMFFSLLAAALLGQWLDDKFELSNDYITLILVVIVFFGFMYKLIKELS